MAYRILFADDSATMQRVLRIAFAREECTVIATKNGAEALAKAKEMRPDVALIDVGMPGMDGYAVCLALRADPATTHIPVLLMASNQQPIDPSRATACGAKGHIVKPFEINALLTQVQALRSAPLASGAPVNKRPPPLPTRVPPAARSSQAPPAAPPPRPMGWGPPHRMTPHATPSAVSSVVSAPALQPERPTPALGTIAASWQRPVSPAQRVADAASALPAKVVNEVVAKAPEATSALNDALARVTAETPLTPPGALPIDQAVLMQMAREILERVAWEVVPSMAENIIRSQLAEQPKQ